MLFTGINTRHYLPQSNFICLLLSYASKYVSCACVDQRLIINPSDPDVIRSSVPKSRAQQGSQAPPHLRKKAKKTYRRTVYLYVLTCSKVKKTTPRAGGVLSLLFCMFVSTWASMLVTGCWPALHDGIVLASWVAPC